MNNRNIASMNRHLCLSTVALVIFALYGCQSPPQPSRVAGDGGGATKAPAPKAAASSPYSIPTELDALNNLFLDGYGVRQAAIKSNTSPIIVSSFSSLILIRDGKSETNKVIPPIYHSLKAIAHVPFGIFLRVDPYARNPAPKLPSSTVTELQQYQTQIEKALGSLPSAGYSSQQLARQRKILEGCQAFLNRAITEGKVSRSELLAFTGKIGPMMLANADEAARAQIDTMHSVVMKWKRSLLAEEWKRLVVVVRGFQMARRLNICTQYLAKVVDEPEHHLGYPLESRRLIYAEFIMKDRDHLDLMATTLIDGDASEAFFGDRWRMSRDVLADGAAEHIRTLKFD